MPEFIHLSLVLQTNSLEETESFYIKQLGFELVSKEADFLFLVKDYIQLTFHLPDPSEDAGEPFFTGVLSIITDHIEVLYNKLKDDEGMISENIEVEEDFLKEFYIKDNNGYVLNFKELNESDEE